MGLIYSFIKWRIILLSPVRLPHPERALTASCHVPTSQTLPIPVHSNGGLVTFPCSPHLPFYGWYWGEHRDVHPSLLFLLLLEADGSRFCPGKLAEALKWNTFNTDLLSSGNGQMGSPWSQWFKTPLLGLRVEQAESGRRGPTAEAAVFRLPLQGHCPAFRSYRVQSSLIKPCAPRTALLTGRMVLGI